MLAMLAMTITPANAQERWTHAASGTSFPEAFETQALVKRLDLGTPNDTVIDYEAATGTESTPHSPSKSLILLSGSQYFRYKSWC
ncbi:hypothetical protein FJQ54_13975 [Sandaracinobacter neustonicus]|uniref:Uncharacterized protein n=1 Tax=Sandaracinobacter neustonicus TaxID=1715348 RepID=A0A501XF71_9SPHN|nr:hypothetical protein [Sandaracinobacter neustonicus]TPE59170.1 hypothetical protein FJQ54_13975 [Sandaracinobacter neustonicus]